MIEKYTLILKHDAVIEGVANIQIDPPLVLTHVFERNALATPVILNELMERFKEEVIRRQSEFEGGAT